MSEKVINIKAEPCTCITGAQKKACNIFCKDEPRLKIETKTEFDPYSGKIHVELVFTDKGAIRVRRFFSDKIEIDLSKTIADYREFILDSEYDIKKPEV